MPALAGFLMGSSGRKQLLICRPTLGQGGADRATVTLLKNLDRDSFEISLALMHASGEFLNDVPQDVETIDLEAASLWTAWWPLARELKVRQPDIVFSTSGGFNLVAIIAHRLAGSDARLVLSERSMLRRPSKNLKLLVMNVLKRALYRAADEVTCVSVGVRNDVVSTLGLAPGRVRVVYNPVVTDDLPTSASAPVPHAWFAEDVPIVLGAGRFVPQKAFSVLIEAFAAARKRRHCRLVILGDGPLRDEMERIVSELQIGADVSLPGFDKNPFPYMATCTAFVLSSVQEGLPGVLIQAMACGAPCISTDCPSGPSEIIDNGVDGFLVSVGDVTAIADRIVELIDSPELRSGLSASARISSNRFRVDQVVSNYTDALLAK